MRSRARTPARSKILTHPAVARERFRQIVDRQTPRLPISETALVVALEEYPFVDVVAYLELIDEWASRVREKTSGVNDIERQIDAINSLLYDQEGFHAEEGYYDPRNTFLNDVIDRHGGLPIALSIIYIEISRKLGIDSSGVAMPGATLVKLSGPWGDLLIDPYDEGRVLDREECEDVIKRTFGGALELREHHLRSYTDQEMIARLLAHIKSIHLAGRDIGGAIAAIDRMLILDSYDPWEHRERGILKMQTHKYEEAVADIETYLAMAPQAEDAAKLRAEIERLRHWMK